VKDETQKRLDKASRAIHAAEVLLEDGDADFAASRAYYAMFYTAEALLIERGLRFRKHSSVHAAFAQHFVRSGPLEPKFHRWLLDAFDKRLEADYGADIVVFREHAARMIEQAREFLREARRYLGVSP
jgi:uncharacterized protein (UPF0332 family)